MELIRRWAIQNNNSNSKEKSCLVKQSIIEQEKETEDDEDDEEEKGNNNNLQQSKLNDRQVFSRNNFKRRSSKHEKSIFLNKVKKGASNHQSSNTLNKILHNQKSKISLIVESCMQEQISNQIKQQYEQKQKQQQEKKQENKLLNRLKKISNNNNKNQEQKEEEQDQKQEDEEYKKQLVKMVGHIEDRKIWFRKDRKQQHSMKIKELMQETFKKKESEEEKMERERREEQRRIKYLYGILQMKIWEGEGFCGQNIWYGFVKKKQQEWDVIEFFLGLVSQQKIQEKEDEKNKLNLIRCSSQPQQQQRRNKDQCLKKKKTTLFISDGAAMKIQEEVENQQQESYDFSCLCMSEQCYLIEIDLKQMYIQLENFSQFMIFKQDFFLLCMPSLEQVKEQTVFQDIMGQVKQKEYCQYQKITDQDQQGNLVYWLVQGECQVYRSVHDQQGKANNFQICDIQEQAIIGEEVIFDKKINNINNVFQQQQQQKTNQYFNKSELFQKRDFGYKNNSKLQQQQQQQQDQSIQGHCCYQYTVIVISSVAQVFCINRKYIQSYFPYLCKKQLKKQYFKKKEQREKILQERVEFLEKFSQEQNDQKQEESEHVYLEKIDTEQKEFINKYAQDSQQQQDRILTVKQEFKPLLKIKSEKLFQKMKQGRIRIPPLLLIFFNQKKIDQIQQRHLQELQTKIEMHQDRISFYNQINNSGNNDSNRKRSSFQSAPSSPRKSEYSIINQNSSVQSPVKKGLNQKFFGGKQMKNYQNLINMISCSSTKSGGSFFQQSISDNMGNNSDSSKNVQEYNFRGQKQQLSNKSIFEENGHYKYNIERVGKINKNKDSYFSNSISNNISQQQQKNQKEYEEGRSKSLHQCFMSGKERMNNQENYYLKLDNKKGKNNNSSSCNKKKQIIKIKTKNFYNLDSLQFQQDSIISDDKDKLYSHQQQQLKMQLWQQKEQKKKILEKQLNKRFYSSSFYNDNNKSYKQGVGFNNSNKQIQIQNKSNLLFVREYLMKSCSLDKQWREEKKMEEIRNKEISMEQQALFWNDENQ